MHSEEHLLCRICGYKSEEAPWGDDGRSPTFDFCPCCGVEHGYQDSTLAAARRYRDEWVASGAIWEEPQVRPGNWSLEEQLLCVPHEFQ